jgi:hypothetical protein
MAHAGEHTSRTIRIATIGGAVLAGVAAAATLWLQGAGLASAPEPARLSAALSGTAGSSGAALYLSGAPTTVLFYSGSWTAHSSGPAAGTPCSPVALAKDQLATKVIQVNGNYRRCI